MDRRSSLFALLALGAIGGSLPVRSPAQATRGAYRIALLPDFNPAQEPMLQVFIETLRKSGRLEGRDYIFYRSGIFYGPDTEIAVRRVVEAKPDLIFAFNLGYVVAAHKLTKTIPIVMWTSGFPVEAGVAASLARPGKNVTGMTVYGSPEVFGKLVQLLHDTKPGIKRMGVLFTYVSPFHPPAETIAGIRAMRDAGHALGIDLRILEISRPEQMTDVLATVVTERIEALLLTSGASTAMRRQEIMRFAVEKRLPTITDAHWVNVEPQPLLSYGGFIPSALMQKATAYVERILWGGAKPGDLPIQLPARVELIVNQKTARSIGITVPPLILRRADQVIE